MPTPATCSRAPSPRSPTNSRSSPGIATRRDATFASIEKTILAITNPLDDPDGVVAQMADYDKLGIDLVELMPVGDPIAFTTQVGERIVPALAQLG